MGYSDKRLFDGETVREVVTGFDGVIREAESRGVESAAIFSNGTAIRLWAGYSAINLTPEAASRDIGNTGVLVLNGISLTGWSVSIWYAAVDTVKVESA